jgi:hypothetical protein
MTPKRLQRAGADMFGRLALFLTDNDVEAACGALRGGVNATRIVRGERNPAGGYIYREEPDHPIRVAAAKIIIEHTCGKPVTRSVVANVDATAEVPVEQWLEARMADPSTARSLAESIIRNAELAEKAQKRQTIDVQALPEAPPQPSNPQSEAPQR